MMLGWRLPAGARGYDPRFGCGGESVKASRTRIVWVAVFFVYFFITMPAAHAYVDPGTGSYVFQVLLGVLLGAVVAVKLWWRKMWAFVSRKRSPKEGETGEPSRPAR
jgi:hypothetical protein